MVKPSLQQRRPPWLHSGRACTAQLQEPTSTTVSRYITATYLQTYTWCVRCRCLRPLHHSPHTMFCICTWPCTELDGAQAFRAAVMEDWSAVFERVAQGRQVTTRALHTMKISPNVGLLCGIPGFTWTGHYSARTGCRDCCEVLRDCYPKRASFQISCGRAIYSSIGCVAGQCSCAAHACRGMVLSMASSASKSGAESYSGGVR